MRCPVLAEFPPPPPDKTGWPWTEETPQLPETMVDGSLWPRVSIVTPSYNQDQFIEETIRSVLLQGYPNLEYIVIDGGSTDDSVEIIKKYEPWLAYWVSEEDRGQSHAINKGFEHATGDIFAWLNSDDYYIQQALYNISVKFNSSNWLLGIANIVDNHDKLASINPVAKSKKHIDACFKLPTKKNFPTAQPAHFWSKEIWKEVGFLNEKYHYCMDLDWMIRALSKRYRPLPLHQSIVCMRIQPHAKTSNVLWAFDFESAAVYFTLGKKGVLKRIPALNVSRKYVARGLRTLSDGLFQDGKKFASLMSVMGAWVISAKPIGGSHWTRVKRVFV